MIIKVFRFWTRKRDLTHAEAVDYWTQVHLPQMLEMADPALVRYAANIGQPANYQGWAPDEAPPFDGADEYWYDLDTVDRVVERLRSISDELRDRERRFIGTFQIMVTDQVIHVDRRRRHMGTKLLFLFTRRPDMTPSDCAAYWRDHHTQLVRSTLGDALVRYTTNVGLNAGVRGWSPDEAPPFDGVAELSFDHSIEAQLALVTQAAPVLVPDERRFIGTFRMLFVNELLNRGRESDELPS